MHVTRTTVIAVCATLGLLASLPVSAQEGTRVVGKFGDWTLYAHDGAAKICFLASEPKSSEPKGANRDAVLFYVSGWPKEGVKTEASVKLGYSIKKGAPATATIGSATFKLLAADDRGFVADPTDELKLIEAMRKGASLVVSATSERGTATRDTFSLQGVGQGLAALANGCG